MGADWGQIIHTSRKLLSGFSMKFGVFQELGVIVTQSAQMKA